MVCSGHQTKSIPRQVYSILQHSNVRLVFSPTGKQNDLQAFGFPGVQIEERGVQMVNSLLINRTRGKRGTREHASSWMARLVINFCFLTPLNHRILVLKLFYSKNTAPSHFSDCQSSITFEA